MARSCSRARPPTCAPTPIFARSGWRSDTLPRPRAPRGCHGWDIGPADPPPRIARPFYFLPTEGDNRMSATYEVHGPVAVITMNNPPVNGLGFATRQAIAAGLDAAAADPAVKAVVVTVAGRAFS